MVTIHQPDFMPWLGFFDRWAKSDLYVVLDDVQFLRRGWHHRDKIKTPQGPAWLTVPVKNKGRYEQQIREVEIDNDSNWRRKHLSTIQNAYSKAPKFDRLFPKIEAVYLKNHKKLVDFNLDILLVLAAEFGIKTPFAPASDFQAKGQKSERLVNLVKLNKGSRYLTGKGARSYLDEDLFAAEGLEVIWQDFEHPVYPQLHGEFQPGLSALDYLMCRNGDEAFRVGGYS
jgi:hypothetical protein